jgi:hypothetical protein
MSPVEPYRAIQFMDEGITDSALAHVLSLLLGMGNSKLQRC